jgi:mannonate dehydratase
MNRRNFHQRIVASATAAATGSFSAPPASAAPPARRARRNTLMHIGGDYHSVAGSGIASKENLEYNLRHGVKHLTAQLRQRAPDGGWDEAEMKSMRDACDQHGVALEAIRMDPAYIGLQTPAERDRELERIAGNIEKAGRAGVSVVTYHWTVIPIRRNRETPGRGNSTYAGFELEKNWQDLPVGAAGRVSAQEYWDRIHHFLERVIPVAKEHGVKMACHPYDPPGLPFGYQGAENWDSPSVFDAIKKYEAAYESPHNGFQLCLGTVAEGLRNPKTEILPIVRYLAERGKICQIHMRNIRGGLGKFEEVYPDEGELDFLEIMRILRDAQFAGSICPDHMPRHPDDPKGLQSFAFGYGYIKALIQAASAEVR